jgi:ABC-type nitrate/sulfonate/bicarbonate transport system substrate-binding protein
MFVVVLSLVALLFSVACAPAKPAEAEQIPLWSSPNAAVPVAVAVQEGFFEELGVNIDLRVTFEDEPPFLAGKTPITQISSWEVAKEVAAGEDIMVAGVGGAVRMFHGLAVQPENYPNPYGSVQDLVGKKLGIPGFGTGVWAAFAGFTKFAWDIDAEEDFEITTASPGALLGLLETGQIDGALLFASQTIAAMATGFPLVFNFADAWEAETGQPLMIVSWVARTGWLKDNIETMRSINAAMDKAVDWAAAHPEEFNVGGRYEIYARQAGWLNSEETTALLLDWLVKGKHYTKQEDFYTQEWIDAAHKFSVASLGDSAPPKDKVFWPVEDLR